jgi:hypothetical protein
MHQDATIAGSSALTAVRERSRIDTRRAILRAEVSRLGHWSKMNPMMLPGESHLERFACVRGRLSTRGMRWITPSERACTAPPHYYGARP